MKKTSAYLVWSFANLFATGLIVFGFNEGGAIENTFLMIFYLFVYFYTLSFLWNLLQSHLKLLAEINEYEVNDSTIISTINEITQEVIENTPFWLLILPFYYWMFRLIALPIGWLKNGYWSEFNTCEVLPGFCTYEGSAVGLNKIILWIGNNDFGIFFSLLFLICSWIATKILKSNSLN